MELNEIITSRSEVSPNDEMQSYVQKHIRAERTFWLILLGLFIIIFIGWGHQQNQFRKNLTQLKIERHDRNTNKTCR